MKKPNGRSDAKILPHYMEKLIGKTTSVRASKRAENAQESTSKTKVDWDVNITLPQQWALQQPEARRDRNGCIARAASPSMRWDGICAGRDGARLIVITLLQWGLDLRNASEVLEWHRIAVDIAQVLRVLAKQAYAAPTSESGPVGMTLGPRTNQGQTRERVLPARDR